MKHTQKIDDDVRAHLLAMQWRGNIATIAKQLDRPTYERVNKVLELAGGKWSRKDKGHVFDENGQDNISDAIETGFILDKKKALQFFETPDALADKMVEALCYSSGSVMEPSAGKGALIGALWRAGVKKEQIHAIEIDPENAKHCEKFIPGRVSCGDFLKATGLPLFGNIIANPPFSNGQDVDHATKMIDLLGKGGRMVCITSPAWRFRTGKKWADFRVRLQSLNAEVEELPQNSFASSGTNVNTLMLTIRR
jgi:phospholipid N-methyltransferase